MKTSITAATMLIIAGLPSAALAQMPNLAPPDRDGRPGLEHRVTPGSALVHKVHHAGRRCLPRWRIRSRLHRRGFTRLRVLDRRRHVVVVKARRAGGRRYILRVNRCNGRIIASRRVAPRWAGRLHRHGWGWHVGVHF